MVSYTARLQCVLPKLLKQSTTLTMYYSRASSRRGHTQYGDHKHYLVMLIIYIVIIIIILLFYYIIIRVYFYSTVECHDNIMCSYLFLYNIKHAQCCNVYIPVQLHQMILRTCRPHRESRSLLGQWLYRCGHWECTRAPVWRGHTPECSGCEYLYIACERQHWITADCHAYILHVHPYYFHVNYIIYT